MDGPPTSGNESEFEHAILVSRIWLKQEFGEYAEGTAHWSFPDSKKVKFTGKLTHEKREFIQHIAKTYGILLDPFYNAGLFQFALEEIEHISKNEKCLIIHSGGVAGLLGYLK